jgi:hypothetical protein
LLVSHRTIYNQKLVNGSGISPVSLFFSKYKSKTLTARFKYVKQINILCTTIIVSVCNSRCTAFVCTLCETKKILCLYTLSHHDDSECTNKGFSLFRKVYKVYRQRLYTCYCKHWFLPVDNTSSGNFVICFLFKYLAVG